MIVARGLGRGPSPVPVTGGYGLRETLVLPFPGPIGSGGRQRWRVPPGLLYAQRLRLMEDDELIPWLLAAMPGVTRRH